MQFEKEELLLENEIRNLKDELITPDSSEDEKTNEVIPKSNQTTKVVEEKTLFNIFLDVVRCKLPSEYDQSSLEICYSRFSFNYSNGRRKF